MRVPRDPAVEEIPTILPVEPEAPMVTHGCPDMVRITCLNPECRSALQIQRSEIGQAVCCPKCNVMFVATTSVADVHEGNDQSAPEEVDPGGGSSVARFLAFPLTLTVILMVAILALETFLIRETRLQEEIQLKELERQKRGEMVIYLGGYNPARERSQWYGLILSILAAIVSGRVVGIYGTTTNRKAFFACWFFTIFAAAVFGLIAGGIVEAIYPHPAFHVSSLFIAVISTFLCIGFGLINGIVCRHRQRT